MPLMKSPAGDMEITISSVSADDTRLITTGKLGAWDSTIYFTADDVMDMAKLMLNRQVIGFLLKLPVWIVKKMLSGPSAK
ncbi:MAG TPA: hypothetical protein PLT09_09050 [Deltaproteobacteria bacterium]|nr:hypothetical protein [Deltaproteobacteria bacterium]HPR53713.1 hypothetical protein [Deltaproteobacteria bacterium]HXK47579.1 hypothetical protein [Deltaproteobacteria bacterium]